MKEVTEGRRTSENFLEYVKLVVILVKRWYEEEEMSGFAALNHLNRWTVGQTTTLEYCDSHFSYVNREEKMAHDDKNPIP